MRCHVSQPILAGSTRVVSSPLPETSLLARSCNKAERERYFVFGESLRSRFSRSSTTLTRDGKVPVASSKGRPNRTLTISRSSIVWCESAPRSDPTRISDFRDLACRSASDPPGRCTIKSSAPELRSKNFQRVSPCGKLGATRCGSASLWPPYDYHNDFGSVGVSIEGSGSPPILASKPRNR
jgi:hypothetical protein